MAQPLNKPDLLNPYKAQELQTSTEEAVLTQLDEFRANNIPKVEAIRAELKPIEEALNDIREEARKIDMLERVQTLVPSLKKLPSNKRDEISMRLLEERDYTVIGQDIFKNDCKDKWKKSWEHITGIFNSLTGISGIILVLSTTDAAKESVSFIRNLTSFIKYSERSNDYRVGLIIGALVSFGLYKGLAALKEIIEGINFEAVAKEIEELPNSSLADTSPTEDPETPNPQHQI